MRTINSKKKRFAGSVIVKNKSVFIDTADGVGFHKVFELMEPYIHLLARFGLSVCPWSSLEDMRQEVCVLILEGIPKYSPERGASLSTFLHKFIKNKLIDYSRKKDPLRGRCSYISIYDDDAGFYYDPLDPIEKIDLIRKIQCWDNKWRRVMFRIFINEEKVGEIAKDEKMTPWGLTRAIRRKLTEARELG